MKRGGGVGGGHKNITEPCGGLGKLCRETPKSSSPPPPKRKSTNLCEGRKLKRKKKPQQQRKRTNSGTPLSTVTCSKKNSWNLDKRKTRSSLSLFTHRFYMTSRLQYWLTRQENSCHVGVSNQSCGI